MTPEKLAELEALEAAATPGELTARGQRIEQAGLSVAYCPESFICGVDGTRSISSTEANANAKALAALRNNARDLFAALREAWRERDEARAQVDLLKKECASLSEEFGLPPTMRPAEGEIRRFMEERRTAMRERDEARAALRLLWEEATDVERCVASSEATHHLSGECRAAVEAALRAGR